MKDYRHNYMLPTENQVWSDWLWSIDRAVVKRDEGARVVVAGATNSESWIYCAQKFLSLA